MVSSCQKLQAHCSARLAQKQPRNLWCYEATLIQVQSIHHQYTECQCQTAIPPFPSCKQTSIPFSHTSSPYSPQPPHSLGSGLRCMTGFSTVSQAGPASVRFRGEVRAMLSSAVYTSPSARPKAEFRA